MHGKIAYDKVRPDEPIADRGVKDKFLQAWARSRPNGGGKPIEYGVVAMEAKESGGGQKYETGFFTDKKPTTVDIDTKVRNLTRSQQRRIRATGHSHPNAHLASEASYDDLGWLMSPDTPAAIRTNVHYIFAHDGVYRLQTVNNVLQQRYLGTLHDVLGK